MKPEYGPTLGRLLSPRWRAASPLVRWAVIAAGCGAARSDPPRGADAREQHVLAWRESSIQLQLQEPLPGGSRPRRVRQGAAPQLQRSAEGLIRGRAAAAAALLRHPLRRAAGVRDGVHEGAGGSATHTSSCGARARPKSTRSPPTPSLTPQCSRGGRCGDAISCSCPKRPGAREGVDLVMLTSPEGELPGQVADGSGVRGGPVEAAEDVRLRLRDERHPPGLPNACGSERHPARPVYATRPVGRRTCRSISRCSPAWRVRPTVKSPGRVRLEPAQAGEGSWARCGSFAAVGGADWEVPDSVPGDGGGGGWGSWIRPRWAGRTEWGLVRCLGVREAPKAGSGWPA